MEVSATFLDRSPAIEEPDAGERDREREPGQGVLQMIVRQLDAALPADRITPRIGRGARLKIDRHELAFRRACGREGVTFASLKPPEPEGPSVSAA